MSSRDDRRRRCRRAEKTQSTDRPEGRHFRVPLPLVGHRLRLTDSSAPNPLDRLRPFVAVRDTLLVGERVVPCEDI